MLNHIELFAGCGGLSLGLKKAGFALTLANELSPMAAETFAFNHLGEDLSALAQKGISPEKVFWISSQYEALAPRLRENPFAFPQLGEGFSDIPQDLSLLEGGLVVGNIVQLNDLLESNKSLLKLLRTSFGKGELDLVSGGPPCQGFSLAGLREKSSDKNLLPWEFARFVKLTKPKIALLENVSGILRPFTENGVAYYAWFEVAKAFAEIGYIPLCLHINARHAGVPQNRPRFIMIAVRSDFYTKLEPNFSNKEFRFFETSKKFHKSVKAKKNVFLSDLEVIDTHKGGNFDLLRDTFLSELIDHKEVDIKTALDDLKFKRPAEPSKHVNAINLMLGDGKNVLGVIQNHELRNNNPLVQRRFRLYQILQHCEKSVYKSVSSILKGLTSELHEQDWGVLNKFKYLGEDGELFRPKNKELFEHYLLDLATKKLTQKALVSHQVASAALSIPDDVCHYDPNELRTLTVREMARIQSFPDSFIFKSKATTGGTNRRFEVPQYTQVGNAVPPLLGYRLGMSVRAIISFGIS